MIDVDPRHTSDRCEACGNPARENRVTRRCSDASAVGTRPTPRNTPPATSSGLDWPFLQPTKLREKKLTALAVREVTWAVTLLTTVATGGAKGCVPCATADEPAVDEDPHPAKSAVLRRFRWS
jgi:hypothetical protein